MERMKGWRTLVWNVVIVMGGAALAWASGIDWTQYFSPTVAMFVVAGVNVALRVVTNTPVGEK